MTMHHRTTKSVRFVYSPASAHPLRSVLWAPLLLLTATAWGLQSPARAKDPAPKPVATPSPVDPNDARMSSWATQNGGRYARVVETRGGAPVTTWPSPGLPNRSAGQTKPAYSDIQEVSYSNDWVYVRGTGLASHQMGPWYMQVNRIFDNWPSNQNYIRRFPRHPKVTDQKVTNGGGALGLWVNGVALFNLLDMFAYNAQAGRDVQGGPRGGGSAIWWRNAVVVEAPTFDASNAHQPESGEYHYHDNPVALRAQLGDNVGFDTKTGRYHEDTSHLHHSPILGWSYDGFPIYGPYGYSDARDPKSGIRRIVAGFVIRDGQHGTEDLRITGRKTLGKWAAALHSVDAKLTDDQFGPDISPRNALGKYVEDFDYLGDHGAVQGRDFDLDIYNGRFCVTPEFPKGTYAYFVTLNADGSPAFPYALGRQWYGVPQGGQGTKIPETVNIFRSAGPNAATVVASHGGKSVSWPSAEGGHYTLLSSTDGQSWTPVATDVKSDGAKTTYALASSSAPPHTRYEARLTALDPYDNVGAHGGFGGPGGRRRGGPGGGAGGQGGPGAGGPAGAIAQSTPATGKRGESITVRLTLGDEPPAPPAEITPLSARIGNLVAKSVTWDGQTITAKFEFPAGMPTGAQNVVVTFPAPPDRGGDLVFTGPGAFTVR